MKPAFIVEGHSDARQVNGALKELEDYKIIVTDGTKVNNSLIIKIQEVIENGYTPYVLSDPDIAGDMLYHMIKSQLHDIQRIEANKDECVYYKDIRKMKHKFGIEYASYKYLRELLVPYL